MIPYKNFGWWNKVMSILSIGKFCFLCDGKKEKNDKDWREYHQSQGCKSYFLCPACQKREIKTSNCSHP